MTHPEVRIPAAVAKLRPGWDRVLRMHRRYTSANGDALAGAATYGLLIGGLPALLLAGSALSAVGVDAGRVTSVLHTAAVRLLPGDVVATVDTAPTGPLSLRVALAVALLWSGLRMIRALRTGVRAMCGQRAGSGNPIHDLVVDAGLGVLLLVAAAAATIVVATTTDGSGWRVLITAPVIAALATGLMLRFSWPGAGRPGLPAALRAAAGAAILIELLGVAASSYFDATAAVHDDIYRGIGALIGALVWCSLAVRILLRSAAWAATA